MIGLLNVSHLMHEMPWKHPNPSGTYYWKPSPLGFSGIIFSQVQSSVELIANLPAVKRGKFLLIS